MAQAPHRFWKRDRMEERQEPQKKRVFRFFLADELAEKRVVRFFPFQIGDEKRKRSPLGQQAKRRTGIALHQKGQEFFAEPGPGEPTGELQADRFMEPIAGAPFELIVQSSGKSGGAEDARGIIFKALRMQDAYFLGFQVFEASEGVPDMARV